MTTKVQERQPVNKEFRNKGIPILTGDIYFRDWPRIARPVSLKEIQKILAKFKGNLAQEIIKNRAEERA